jgi:predicted dehydrogenase
MKQMSRRDLLSVGAGLTGITILPSHVLGLGGATPPSERMNLAFCGIGMRGALDLQELSDLKQNVVAVCDVDWSVSSGFGGRAQAGPPTSRTAATAAKYPNAKKYDDYRKMLEEQEKNIDGVVVATPDHTHAVIALQAMKMKKHVYVEKNMCRTVEEARRMIDFEKKYKVVGQVGNQGHSSEDIRLVVEWFRAGAIGDVKEVHIFHKDTASSPRALPQTKLDVTYENIPALLAQKHDIPEGLHWDLFLGPAKDRAYNPAYHPNRWRAWLDYGTGNSGDYLDHLADPVAWALELGYPTHVEAQPERGYDWKTNKEVYPWSGMMKWSFPARGKMPPVEVYFHYGPNKELDVPKPPGWREGFDNIISQGGGFMFGSKGAIQWGALYASKPLVASTQPAQNVSWGTPEIVRLWPPELNKDFKRPDPTIPRPFNHWADWVESAKAGKPASSSLPYGGLMSELAIIGNAANAEPGKKLEYDGKKGKFKNSEEANKMAYSRSYRKGWELPG